MNQELWHAFDRIKAGLDKQERMRSTSGFGEWCVRALPEFSKYLDLVDKWYDEALGTLHCEWMDWLDHRGLEFRGQLRWKIPMRGPLTFYPPTMEWVTQRAAEITDELGLRDALTHSVRLSEALTRKTRGDSGGKGTKKSQRRK